MWTGPSPFAKGFKAPRSGLAHGTHDAQCFPRTLFVTSGGTLRISVDRGKGRVFEARWAVSEAQLTGGELGLEPWEADARGSMWHRVET